MNRHAQSAVMFLLGATLLHAGSTDLYLRYVKSGLRPLLLLSGAVLIAAAVATVWYERRGPRKEHQHQHHEPRVSWLLVLPLLALVLVAPPALGSYSAMRTGTALQQPYGYDELPAKGPLRLGVADYAGRAVYDQGRSIKGRELKVTGFLAMDRAGHPYLVRMALNCCAADAQPVKIALTGAIPPVLRPDAWLEVTGTYTPERTKDPVNNGPIPYLKVTEARPATAPADPYDETWNE
ncbi:TIGR03943 family protein [Streptomyces sp. S.PB5]|uniref:TIGR03943 family putative permease subunit n=1 Tax=Streptomyces sp. S.PB5 TaxID=3020844 RepID=UPI0025B1ED6E|nr:TIGR03943 family protein [Streptomyces sp. S.PB5]MDN3026381.1 TIGR03943 family protein [Streptomyces sp. S.PB5]